MSSTFLRGHGSVSSLLLATVLFSGGAAAFAQDADTNAPTRWEVRAQEKTKLYEGIIGLTHEPLDFLLRRGDHFDDEPEQYQKMTSPENIKRMAAAGQH